MTRIPASVSPESADYRGPLLMNPGGPGGSGVDLVLSSGPLFQAIVGPQFDILGFDPRGAFGMKPGFDNMVLISIQSSSRSRSFYAWIQHLYVRNRTSLSGTELSAC